MADPREREEAGKRPGLSRGCLDGWWCGRNWSRTVGKIMNSTLNMLNMRGLRASREERRPVHPGSSGPRIRGSG